jgi:hypothetical protein
VGSGYKTFTAGEVLTASSVQNFLQNQTVMSFAGSAARSSAIGTANFEEGMTSYLQDTNLVEVYNGTNWASIAPSGPTPGLVQIGTAISFSAVASQSFNDVFSTTYDNYRIVFEATCSANVTIDMRLRVSGADNSSANYWNNRTLGAGSTPQSFGASSAETAWSRVGEFETGISTGTYDVYSPFKTQITSLAGVNQFRYTSVYQHSCMKTGQTTVTTSYTGFTLFPSSGTMTGTVSVYGYNK